MTRAAGSRSTAWKTILPPSSAPKTPPRRIPGSSPRNLTANTFGDELKNAGFPSRVVSVSRSSDRAAILMGGHRADLAFWFDPKAFRWVSSRFYLPDEKLPEWLARLNQDVAAEVTREGPKPLEWKAAGPGTGFSDETPMTPFSHAFVPGSQESLATPLGLELTRDAALRAASQYALGRGKSTDVLAVSFSSHDWVGHAYGPNSREMEEMTVAEDSVLSELLNGLRVSLPGGLKDVAIVLTADHGMPASPDYLAEHRHPGGRLAPDDLSARIEEALNGAYGKIPGGKWVRFTDDLKFYLNRPWIARRHLDLARVEATAKAAIAERIGVQAVFTSEEVAARKLPPGMLERQILHTYIAGQSGDVDIVPKPYYMVATPDKVAHHTGYAYDRTVPIILSGAWFRPGVYSRRAEVIDIAPTLSFISGTIPPDATEGRVLSEGLVSEAR